MNEWMNEWLYKKWAKLERRVKNMVWRPQWCPKWCLVMPTASVLGYLSTESLWSPFPQGMKDLDQILQQHISFHQIIIQTVWWTIRILHFLHDLDNELKPLMKLVQVMVCGLFSKKPSPESMLTYRQLAAPGTKLIEMWIQLQGFSFKNIDFKVSSATC